MKQLNIYFFFIIFIFILVVIMIMVAIAFLTLMERKFLSYLQIRKGPNKVGFMGVLQPFGDAIKLLSKESNLIMKSNYMLYFISPIMGLILMIMMWMIYPFYVNFLMFNMGFIYLMSCFSLGVYMLLLSGWSSNSSYALLGSLRSLAQSISYEVSLSIIMIIPMFLINEFNLIYLFNYQNLWFMFYMWPLGLIFFFSIMAELNRTPFDFSEGESELVSGFNVEYGSFGFILIFLSEYGSILFLSFLFNMFFMGGKFFNIMFYIQILLLVFTIIWIRGTLPRFRYDLLMYLCWLVILPITLNYMLYMIFFKIFVL